MIELNHAFYVSNKWKSLSQFSKEMQKKKKNSSKTFLAEEDKINENC